MSDFVPGDRVKLKCEMILYEEPDYNKTSTVGSLHEGETIMIVAIVDIPRSFHKSSTDTWFMFLCSDNKLGWDYFNKAFVAEQFFEKLT